MKEGYRIIYIEYRKGLPFDVIIDYNDGRQVNYDIEVDPYDPNGFMYYHSGSGGGIRDLQAPHFIRGAKASYWMHPEAKYKRSRLPINCKRLDAPIAYKEGWDPFKNGREVHDLNYCKVCEKMYDEEYCPEHHIFKDGEVYYTDGTLAEN